MRAMKKKYILYSLILAFLVFGYFNRIFLDGHIFTERDLAVFFYPNIRCWTDSSAEPGHLWNRYIMCGEPLHAGIQPGYAYPLSILYRVLPVDTAFNIMIPLHFFLSGVFMFMLLKEMKARDHAAALAGITFVFSGYLLSVHNLYSTLLSVTWFPLLLAVYLRSVRTGSLCMSFLGSAVLYCMFTAGGMEVCIMAGLLLALLTALPLLYPAGTVCAPARVRIRIAVITCIVFVGLSAVQLLPFAALVGNSIRSEGISYQQAVLWSLAPENLIYLFIPDVFWKGYDYYWKDQAWLKTIYTGLIPAGLAVFIIAEKGSRRIFIAAAAAVSLFLAFGKYNPAYPFLFKWVPVLDSIRYPVKFLFIDIFFLCIACGLGWDVIAQGYKKPGVRRLGIISFVLLCCCGSIVLAAVALFSDSLWSICELGSVLSESELTKNEIVKNCMRVLLFGIIASLWLYAVLRNNKSIHMAFYGICFLLICDLFLGNYGYYASVERSEYHRPGQNTAVLLDDPGVFRLFGQEKIQHMKFSYDTHEGYLRCLKNALSPNLLIENKLQDISGFSVLSLVHYFKILTLVQSAPYPDSTRLVDMMNVKYVLWSEELHRPGYELLRTDGRLYLYENHNVLPRAFLVNGYRVVTGDEQYRKTLQSRKFNPSETVLLMDVPEIEADSSDISEYNDSVCMKEYSNERAVFEVTSARKQFLFMSDTWYPGWKAYIDGKETHIYRANYAFRAVAVPPGQHTVMFCYKPWWYTAGIIISLVTLASILLLSLYRHAGNRPYPPG